MLARVEIYRDDALQYRWCRRAANGNITAQGQAHRWKWNAKRAARRNFPGLPVVDLTKGRRGPTLFRPGGLLDTGGEGDSLRP